MENISEEEFLRSLQELGRTNAKRRYRWRHLKGLNSSYIPAPEDCPHKLYNRDMARVNVSKAREGLPEIVSRAAQRKERTIVSRRGKDLAAIIPIEDLRLLERLSRQEQDRLDIADARAALAEPGKNVSLSRAKRELAR